LRESRTCDRFGFFNLTCRLDPMALPQLIGSGWACLSSNFHNGNVSSREVVLI
jgi:hypothetical protein